MLDLFELLLRELDVEDHRAFVAVVPDDLVAADLDRVLSTDDLSRIAFQAIPSSVSACLVLLFNISTFKDAPTDFATKLETIQC